MQRRRTTEKAIDWGALSAMHQLTGAPLCFIFVLQQSYGPLRLA